MKKCSLSVLNQNFKPNSNFNININTNSDHINESERKAYSHRETCHLSVFLFPGISTHKLRKTEFGFPIPNTTLAMALGQISPLQDNTDDSSFPKPVHFQLFSNNRMQQRSGFLRRNVPIGESTSYPEI